MPPGATARDGSCQSGKDRADCGAATSADTQTAPSSAGVCGRSAHRVGHHMPMTDSVLGTTSEAAVTAAGTTTTAEGATVPAIPFGAWPSPITAADVARERLRLSFPIVIGGDTWWQEGRPEEGGRLTIMHRGPGGRLTELLPAPWNARSRVHEYGGLSYLPVPRAAARPGSAGSRAPRGFEILFANYAEQRLYLAGPETPGRRGGTAPPPSRSRGRRRARKRSAVSRGPALCRLRPVAGPQRGLVRAGTPRRRQGQPVDRRGPAGWLGGGEAGGGPRPRLRLGFLRLPHPVTRWQQAGLGVLEPPAYAVGWH